MGVQVPPPTPNIVTHVFSSNAFGVPLNERCVDKTIKIMVFYVDDRCGGNVLFYF